MNIKYPLKMGAYGLLLKLLLNNGVSDPVNNFLVSRIQNKDGIR
jgi:hypothetical protein